MIPTALAQRTVRPTTRSAVGLFVVVSLNLVLQPCAMALGSSGDEDCLRCPPSHVDSHPDHAMQGHAMAGHGMDHHGMANHGTDRHGIADRVMDHGDASGDMPCATGAADCGLADDLNYDGRPFKLELEDSPNDSPIAIHPAMALVPAPRPADATGWHRSRSPPRGPSTPLNVLHCVYLK